MNSDGPSRLEYVDFGDDAIELLYVTPVGPTRCRLDEIPIFSEVAGFHDIIEVEPSPDGGLRFVRVVTPSGFKTVCWIGPKECFKAPAVLSLLERVVAVGGHWEIFLGGILFLHLPPAEEASIQSAFRALWSDPLQAANP